MIDENFCEHHDSTSKDPKTESNKIEKSNQIDNSKKEPAASSPKLNDSGGNIDEENNELLLLLERKKRKYMQLAKLYLSLGHFYLLIYDYSKALDCYQRFFKFRLHKLQVSVRHINSSKRPRSRSRFILSVDY